ncbi:DUF559 domain-containing protein [Rhodococcus sp. H36-A4]|uniref:DUF559 domain-containing protein n=1 Tax=Rhodococcus sp. H36-A4 TaxID=3004353 RepID=UPI0022AFE5B5|nr:DUF559 domain-containing protein [Rhodococcus sp. H36-A4]MCZ4078105.1 DUF559 domain-containing protein [Rhodococcus sp. H36-A4]
MTIGHVDTWGLPLDRAVCLVGAPGDAIAVALEDLSDTAAALIRVHVGPRDRQAAVIEQVLSALTTIAIELFPAWLPDASSITGCSSLDFAAVRIHARRLAATSDHYGPFLADLAERSLGNKNKVVGRQFSDAEVAEGLAGILGASWQRAQVALLLDSDELSSMQQRALAAASEWLAARGFAVWLVDNPVPTVDRLSSVFVTLPRELLEVEDTGQRSRTRPAVEYWAVAGRPHPGSDVEKSVDRELSKRSWATNRRLNHPFQYNDIAQKYFLDIVWLEDLFAVELDGHEHRSVWSKAKDDKRDEILRGVGFEVLRIPNERVHADVWQVVDEIQAALYRHRIIRDSDPNILTATKEGSHQ